MTDWQVLFYLASIRFWRASPCARARAVYELPRPPSGHALLRLTRVKQRFNPHLTVRRVVLIKFAYPQIK